MTTRYDRAVEAIDAANADDPVALDHGRRAVAWVERLAPGAGEAQLLAARAHHLRRAAVPRSSYPDGRAGYLRWRREAKERHATEVAELLAGVGYEAGVVADVQALVRKVGLGTDLSTQVHEDAACLVFLETGFDALADDLGDDKTVDVLRKTARKMSPAALAVAGDLPLSARAGALLARALDAAEAEPGGR